MTKTDDPYQGNAVIFQVYLISNPTITIYFKILFYITTCTFVNGTFTLHDLLPCSCAFRGLWGRWKDSDWDNHLDNNWYNNWYQDR